MKIMNLEKIKSLTHLGGTKTTTTTETDPTTTNIAAVNLTPKLQFNTKQVGHILILDGNNAVGYRLVKRLQECDVPFVRVGVRDLETATPTEATTPAETTDAAETKEAKETKEGDTTETTEGDTKIKATVWGGENQQEGGEGGGSESKTSIETVNFVWEKEETYAAALKGIKTVFVTIPSHPSDFDTHFPHFLTACHRAKTHRIIKLSHYHSLQSRAENSRRYYGNPEYYGTSGGARSTHGTKTKGVPDETGTIDEELHRMFRSVPLVRQHALCDGDLILRGVDCTILFCGHGMHSVVVGQGERMKGEGIFYGGSAGKKVNSISPNDIAEVALHALLHPKTHRKEGYTLTNSLANSLTDDQLATLLSKYFGKTETTDTPIRYENKELSNFSTNTAGFERIKASGLEESAVFAKGDFKKVVGREPESWETYLRRRDRMSPLEKELFEGIDLPEETKEEVKEETKVAAEETKKIAAETKEEEKQEESDVKVVKQEEEDEVVASQDEVEVVEKAVPETTEATATTPVASQ